MDNVLLAKLVETINDHRTWLDAQLSSELVPYYVQQMGTQRVVYGRSLQLAAYHCTDGYPIGQKWIIHEYLLDKSVRKLRAFDAQFAFNLARRRLSLKQIERLIEESSMNFVHLHLDPYGF